MTRGRSVLWACVFGLCVAAAPALAAPPTPTHARHRLHAPGHGAVHTRHTAAVAAHTLVHFRSAHRQHVRAHHGLHRDGTGSLARSERSVPARRPRDHAPAPPPAPPTTQFSGHRHVPGERYGALPPPATPRLGPTGCSTWAAGGVEFVVRGRDLSAHAGRGPPCAAALASLQQAAPFRHHPRRSPRQRRPGPRTPASTGLPSHLASPPAPRTDVSALGPAPAARISARPSVANSSRLTARPGSRPPSVLKSPELCLCSRVQCPGGGLDASCPPSDGDDS